MKKILVFMLLCVTVALGACTSVPVPVLSVTIDKSTLSLFEGSKDNLTATVSPADVANKEVIWRSDDPAVASVSETGEVSALKAGQTRIMAISVSDQTKVGSCQLTVKPLIVPVSGVSLPIDMTISVNTTDTFAIVAEVLPENAADKTLLWSSSDASVLTIDATTSVFTTLKVGTVDITATAHADPTKKATCKVTVSAADPSSTYSFPRTVSAF